MPKLSLTDLASLTNETSAIAAINNNNTLVENALENTLSRDGTSPNSMNSNLDMNSYRIQNLPIPIGGTEPIRKNEFDETLAGIQASQVTNGSVPTPVLGNVGKYLKATGIGNYMWSDVAGSGAVSLTNYNETAVTSKTTFTISGGYTSTSVFVYLNGVLLEPSEYVASNGTTVVLNSVCAIGDEFRCISFAPFAAITLGALASKNTIAAGDIDANAVTDTKIASDAVTDTKIATNAVTNAKIAAGAVLPSKLANGGAELGPRNRIINGAMTIDQQYVGAATSVQGYCLDQWAFGSATGTLTAQRTGSVGNYSLTITATTASTSVNVYQRIESFNIADLAGKTVTVSFTASSNTITTLPWTIVYANALDNFATATGSNSGSITINSTPTRYSFTTTLPAQAVNGIALNISGGLTMTAGNTLVITNVQLEGGSVATPFEQRLWSQELELCKRYWRKSYDINTAPGSLTSVGSISTVANAGGGFRISSSFAPEMRATPSLLAYDPVSGAIGNYRDDASNTSRALFAPLLSSSGFTLSESTLASASSSIRVHYAANARL